MQQNSISIRLIISRVILLLLCLCPLHVNAQGLLKNISGKSAKLPDIVTKYTNITERVRIQKPYIEITPHIVRSITDPPRAHDVIKFQDPNIFNVRTIRKDLRLDLNSNISPSRHTTPNSSITTDISNKWWKQYIQNLIEDQMIQQGKERIEQQLDYKRDSQPNEMEKLYQLIPIKHDIKQEGDRNTSYIYYCAYGYELAA